MHCPTHLHSLCILFTVQSCRKGERCSPAFWREKNPGYSLRQGICKPTKIRRKKKKNGLKYFWQYNAVKHGCWEMRCVRGSVIPTHSVLPLRKCHRAVKGQVRTPHKLLRFFLIWVFDLSQTCNFCHTVVAKRQKQKYTHCSREPRRTQLSRTTAFLLNNRGYFKLFFFYPVQNFYIKPIRTAEIPALQLDWITGQTCYPWKKIHWKLKN